MNPPTAAPHVTMEGWLDKHADWLGKWHRRYVRLTGPVLAYHVLPSEPQKGYCCLMGAQLEHEGEHIRILTELGTTWLFRALSREEHLKWVEAFSSVCPLRKPMPDAVVAQELSPPSPQVQLQGCVKKKSEWLGRWNDRYMIIKGLTVRYADSPSGKIRGTYAIAAVSRGCDPSFLELIMTTTRGTTIEIRLPDEATAAEWFRCLHSSLSRVMALQWNPVTVATMDNSDAYLRASNHSTSAATCPPGPSTPGGVFVFGGTSRSHPSLATVESPDKVFYCGELVMVQLNGAGTTCSKVVVSSFAESPGALIRPHAREGAAATTVGSRFYLYGGASDSTVFGDLWYVDFATTKPAWTSCRGCEVRLPPRVGHTMIAIPANPDELLVIGGIDGQGTVVCTAFFVNTTSGMCRFSVPPLPESRCRHASFLADDGYVYVLGGCSTLSMLSGTSTLWRWSENRSEWHAVPLSGDPLPAMSSVTVARWEANVWLILAGDCSDAPALYSISLASATNDVKACVVRHKSSGEAPIMTHGMSLHIVNGSAYVIGDGARLPLTTGIRRLLLPQ